MKRLYLIIALFITVSTLAAPKTQLKTAVFAGGCFWCMQSDFDKLKGVTKTVAGYTGGKASTATYPIVSSGTTQHVEAVEITYNPKHVSYRHLANYFWHHIDPTDGGGQFCDRGRQYRPVIYYNNDHQKRIDTAIKAHTSKQLNITDRVEITKRKPFYPAEQYHQDYYKKNSLRYRYYRYRCGRDARIRNVWGR
ncbi:MAG: peptide-methionine (S)-S-oxide reductase [Coxiella sp. (in: Bacteria)]|nr:MAG: peptide-methionine (S)-S-oxide reductase [Coxiella sp. (in: g-proteobacteria)]